MPFREYEAKVLVENDENLLQKFDKLGATLLRRVLQRDSYYDIEYRLTKRDELLRIRLEESEDTHSFHAGEFSWKSGREGEQYEVREDISLPLTSPETIKYLNEILKRLGFRKLVSLIKHRERWHLGKVDFEFDRNIEAQAINRPKKLIGSYLQATIETTDEYLPDEMELLLWDSLEHLGFDRTQLKWESYVELYLTQLNDLDSIPSQKKRDI